MVNHKLAVIQVLEQLQIILKVTNRISEFEAQGILPSMHMKDTARHLVDTEVGIAANPLGWGC